MTVLPLPGFHEPVSSLAHLGGALAFGLLSIPLLRRARGEGLRVVFFSLYAASCVLLLSMSGVFHMLPEPGGARAVLGRLDKAAIFVLIAGTHTPVHGLFFRGAARWVVLIAMWSAVAVGITFFTVFYDHLPRGLGTGIYLLLGWLASLSGLVLWRRLGTAQVSLLLAGGVAYSIGAILLGLDWPNLVPGLFGAHELWHMAVLAGMGLHWVFLFKHARQPTQGPCLPAARAVAA